MEAQNAIPNPPFPAQTPPPPGFRELTKEESDRIENLTFRQLYHQEKVTRFEQTARAAEAEAKLARLERQKASAELGLVRAETIHFEQAIGVRKAEDRIEADGKVYIRIQEVKPPPIPKAEVHIESPASPGSQETQKNGGPNGGSPA